MSSSFYQNSKESASLSLNSLQNVDIEEQRVVVATQTEDQSSHNLIPLNIPPPQPQLIAIDQSIKVNEKFTDCQICYTNKISDTSYTTNDTFVFKCGHLFCSQCTKQHFKTFIDKKQFDQFICPEQGCGSKVTQSEVKSLFRNDQAVLSKMQYFQESMPENLLTRFCVQAGCNGRMQASNMNAKQLRCPTCRTSVCFQCREAWHGYCVSCEQAFNSNVGQQLGAPVVWCGVCRTKIVKNEGCNHITCSQCKYEFCYVCHQEYSMCICKMIPIGTGNWLKRIIQMAIFSLIATFIYMMIPMALLLYIPVVSASLFFEFFRLERQPLLILPGLLCGLYCGFILNICAIPVTLCVLPSYVYYQICQICYRRRKNIRNAELRLNQLVRQSLAEEENLAPQNERLLTLSESMNFEN